MHQVETTALMRAGTTEHDEAQVAPQCTGLRRLACAITAVGATIACFSVKYRGVFWSSGVAPGQADWIQDVSPRERANVTSLMQNVQAPSPDQISTTPPSKADALLSAVQLVSGMVSGMVSPLNDAVTPVAKALEPAPHGRRVITDNPLTRPVERRNPISTLAQSKQNISWHTLGAGAEEAGRANVPVRRKKHLTYMEEVTSSNLGRLLNTIMKRENITEVIREDMLYFIADHYKEPGPVFILLKLFEDTINKMKGLADGALSVEKDRRDYHSYFRVLRALWMFSKAFHDRRSASQLAQYEQTLKQGRWQGHEKVKLLGTGSEYSEANIIIAYLASRSVVWREKGLSGYDKIVIHNDEEARIFSIADVIDRQHIAFVESSKSGLDFHFHFDNSGLKDDDLIKLVRSAANPQLFSDFKEEPQFQPDGYYAVVARQLLEKHLEQMSVTPLHFKREETIERLILRAQEKFNPDQQISRATKETITELRRLIVNTSTLNVSEKVVLSYACRLVLGGDRLLYGELDKQDLLSSDYIYRYQSSSGKTLSDVTTLDQFLSRGASEVTSQISRREQVRMVWPAQFSSALIAYLTNAETLIDKFAHEFFSEMAAIKIEKELQKALPPLSARLQNLIDEIASIYGIGGGTFSDEIEFTYQSMVATGDDLITYKKKFTISQIVLGAERAWRLPTLLLYERSISAIPPEVTDDKIVTYEHYVRSLLAFNAQDRLIDQLNDLKKHEHIKEQFELYFDLIVRSVDAGGKPWYQLAQTPLLLVFPERGPTAAEMEAGRRRSNPYGERLNNVWLKKAAIPFHVVSLMTRKINRFESYTDMLQQLAVETPLSRHIKAHFPVGYAAGFDDLELTEVKAGSEQFARWIEFNKELVDSLVKSADEMTAFAVLEYAGDIGVVAGDLILARIRGTALLFAIGSVPVAKILQAMFVSTRPDEQKQLYSEAIRAAFSEIANKVTEHLMESKKGMKFSVQPDDAGFDPHESIDDMTQQGIEWILNRYFFNTTASSTK